MAYDDVELEAQRRRQANRLYNEGRPRHEHRTTNLKKLRRQIRDERPREGRKPGLKPGAGPAPVTVRQSQPALRKTR